MGRWIDISRSDIVYFEGAMCGNGWESEECLFGATFYLTEKGEGLFIGIGTV